MNGWLLRLTLTNGLPLFEFFIMWFVAAPLMSALSLLAFEDCEGGGLGASGWASSRNETAFFCFDARPGSSEDKVEVVCEPEGGVETGIAAEYGGGVAVEGEEGLSEESEAGKPKMDVDRRLVSLWDMTASDTLARARTMDVRVKLTVGGLTAKRALGLARPISGENEVKRGGRRPARGGHGAGGRRRGGLTANPSGAKNTRDRAAQGRVLRREGEEREMPSELATGDRDDPRGLGSWLRGDQEGNPPRGWVRDSPPFTLPCVSEPSLSLPFLPPALKTCGSSPPIKQQPGQFPKRMHQNSHGSSILCRLVSRQLVRTLSNETSQPARERRGQAGSRLREGQRARKRGTTPSPAFESLFPVDSRASGGEAQKGRALPSPPRCAAAPAHAHGFIVCRWPVRSPTREGGRASDSRALDTDEREEQEG